MTPKRILVAVAIIVLVIAGMQVGGAYVTRQQIGNIAFVSAQHAIRFEWSEELLLHKLDLGVRKLPDDQMPDAIEYAFEGLGEESDLTIRGRYGHRAGLGPLRVTIPMTFTVTAKWSVSCPDCEIHDGQRLLEFIGEK